MSLGRSGDSEWRTWSWRRWRRWRTLPRPTPPWSSPAPVRNTSSRWSRDLRQSTTSGQPRGTELTASTASTQPRSGKLETLLEKCDHIDVNRRYLPETISIQLFVSRYIYFQNFNFFRWKFKLGNTQIHNQHIPTDCIILKSLFLNCIFNMFLTSSGHRALFFGYFDS